MNLIYVCGDPIHDVYLETENNKTVSRKTYPGGALNTYFNVAAINENRTSEVEVLWGSPPILKFYELYRVNDSILQIYEDETKENFYSTESTKLLRSLKVTKTNKYSKSILILSDYNKGFLNQNLKIKPNKPIFDIAVIDSKCRSLNKHLFSYAKLNIWRCTGSEFCPEWAKNFQIVVHTDGPNQIKVYEYGTLKFTANPPCTEVVDTCGAGDTFTAAFASCILTTDFSLQESVLFAMKCSQDVIATKRTSITNIKI